MNIRSLSYTYIYIDRENYSYYVRSVCSRLFTVSLLIAHLQHVNKTAHKNNLQMLLLPLKVTLWEAHLARAKELCTEELVEALQ